LPKAKKEEKAGRIISTKFKYLVGVHLRLLLCGWRGLLHGNVLLVCVSGQWGMAFPSLSLLTLSLSAGVGVSGLGVSVFGAGVGWLALVLALALS